LKAGIEAGQLNSELLSTAIVPAGTFRPVENIAALLQCAPISA
jgi:hypothetical protein